jgi:hypothetical protein
MGNKRMLCRVVFREDEKETIFLKVRQQCATKDVLITIVLLEVSYNEIGILVRNCEDNLRKNLLQKY